MATLIYFAATDIGKTRQKNQDSLGAYHPIRPGSADSLFVVCDGMGAHRGGEVASKVAVDEIARAYPALAQQQTPGESLANAIQQAHQKIITQATQNMELRDMGTTAVAAAVRGGTLFVANVGDSRAYLLRGAVLRQITEDHSQVNEMVKAGVISEEEALSNKHRNVLSRSLSALRPSIKVDVFEETLEDGDLVLLCTDGLWGQVPDEVIATTLRRLPLEKALERLIALSNDAGGADNVSVIAVVNGKMQKAPAASFDLMKWIAARPIVSVAIIGIAIALFALFAMALWLFGAAP